MPSHPHCPDRRSRLRPASLTGLAATLALVLAATGCSGSVMRTYRTFASALDRGAPCSELFDQRNRFKNTDTLAKIDADLKRIGCTSPEAKRTDR